MRRLGWQSALQLRLRLPTGLAQSHPAARLVIRCYPPPPLPMYVLVLYTIRPCLVPVWFGRYVTSLPLCLCSSGTRNLESLHRSGVKTRHGVDGWMQSNVSSWVRYFPRERRGLFYRPLYSVYRAHRASSRQRPSPPLRNTSLFHAWDELDGMELETHATRTRTTGDEKRSRKSRDDEF